MKRVMTGESVPVVVEVDDEVPDLYVESPDFLYDDLADQPLEDYTEWNKVPYRRDPFNRIEITIVQHNPEHNDGAFFRITCRGCGHDDVLLPLVPGQKLWFNSPLAMKRALQMHRDHLYAAPGGKRCPIQDYYFGCNCHRDDA